MKKILIAVLLITLSQADTFCTRPVVNRYTYNGTHYRCINDIMPVLQGDQLYCGENENVVCCSGNCNSVQIEFRKQVEDTYQQKMEEAQKEQDSAPAPAPTPAPSNSSSSNYCQNGKVYTALDGNKYGCPLGTSNFYFSSTNGHVTVTCDGQSITERCSQNDTGATTNSDSSQNGGTTTPTNSGQNTKTTQFSGVLQLQIIAVLVLSLTLI